MQLQDPSETSLIEEFRKSLRVLEREVASQLKDENVCCGITSAQCHVILELQEEPRTVSELATLFDLDRSTISRTIDSLVSGGFLERNENPKDRRYSLITLSANGHKKAASINGLCNDSYRNIFTLIPKDKHKMVLEASALLAEAMQKNRSLQSKKRGQTCLIPISKQPAQQ